LILCLLIAPVGPVAAQHAEHQAVLNLVPLVQVTHRAVASGAWSNPATWQNGVLPANNARVHVPAGLNVSFDLNPSPDLRWLRVDGLLRWSSSVDTELRVDTLVALGELQIGSRDATLPAQRQARIVFTDGGAINALDDPTQVGRGLLSMGPVRMWGHPRTPRFVPLAGNESIGATQLELARMPHGWRVGDSVVVAGTRYTGILQTLPMSTSDDEVRTIAALSPISEPGQGMLSIDLPLQRNHHGVTGQAFARAHVANLSCNIVFDSAAGAATPVSRRGHLMLMHQDVQIENVCLYDLGSVDIHGAGRAGAVSPQSKEE